MIQRISKDDTIKKYLHGRQHRFFLASQHSIHIKFPKVLDLPLSEYAGHVREDMLNDKCNHNNSAHSNVITCQKEKGN